MKTPMNAQTLRQHLTYSWWKYALVIILGALAVNLYYTTSAYRAPESAKVELYIYGVGDEPALSEYVAGIQAEKMPEVEEMNARIIVPDTTYGSMMLTTYIAAAEGDIYLLPRDNFVSLASQGAFLPLEDEEALMAVFNEREISLQSGWRRNPEAGVNHLYGIPVSKLPGLSRYVAVENGYLAVLYTNGNTENVLEFLRILCEDMLDAA